MRRCVWSRNLKNEETMTRIGPQRHRTKKILVRIITLHDWIITSQCSQQRYSAAWIFCVLCLAESNISSSFEGIHTPSKVGVRLSPGLSLPTNVYQYKEAWEVQSKVFFQYHITSAVKKDEQLQNRWRTTLETLQVLILSPVSMSVWRVLSWACFAAGYQVFGRTCRTEPNVLTL